MKTDDVEEGDERQWETHEHPPSPGPEEVGRGIENKGKEDYPKGRPVEEQANHPVVHLAKDRS